VDWGGDQLPVQQHVSETVEMCRSTFWRGGTLSRGKGCRNFRLEKVNKKSTRKIKGSIPKKSQPPHLYRQPSKDE